MTGLGHRYSFQEMTSSLGQECNRDGERCNPTVLQVLCHCLCFMSSRIVMQNYEVPVMSGGHSIQTPIEGVHFLCNIFQLLLLFLVEHLHQLGLRD